MECWICGNKTIKYYLIPEKEDNIPIPKTSNYKVITVDKFEFLYYTVCLQCLNMYLDNYPFDFKRICKREVGIKYNPRLSMSYGRKN